MEIYAFQLVCYQIFVFHWSTITCVSESVNLSMQIVKNGRRDNKTRYWTEVKRSFLVRWRYSLWSHRVKQITFWVGYKLMFKSWRFRWIPSAMWTVAVHQSSTRNGLSRTLLHLEKVMNIFQVVPSTFTKTYSKFSLISSLTYFAY